MRAGKLNTFREYALEGQPLDDVYVFDMHGHLGSGGLFDCIIESAKDLITVMDRVGIDTLAVSHLYSLTTDPKAGNDVVASAMERFPGRFLGYAVINPNLPETIEPELDRCFNQLGMKGLKVHADFAGCPLDSPGHWKAYKYIQNHGRQPVLGHGFSADMLRRATREFPDVPFISAHSLAGWNGRLNDPVVDLIAECDNIYGDLCSSLVYYGVMPELIKKVGVHKILFGSDLSWQQATHAIGRVLLADISEEDKGLILGLNSAKLFGVAPNIISTTFEPEGAKRQGVMQYV